MLDMGWEHIYCWEIYFISTTFAVCKEQKDNQGVAALMFDISNTNELFTRRETLFFIRIIIQLIGPTLQTFLPTSGLTSSVWILWKCFYFQFRCIKAKNYASSTKYDWV